MRETYFIIFVCCLNFVNTSFNEGSFDENFSKMIANFVAAAFIPPEKINSTNLAQQCFDKSLPNLKWEKPVIYTRPNCAGFFNGDCQVIMTRSVVYEMVVIAFRGTVTKEQMNHEADDALKTYVHWAYNQTFGLVNKYFFTAAENMWNNEIELYLNNSKNEGYLIAITGHSIGGAIASLTALKASKLGLVSPGKLLLYTFGEPRIGDSTLAKNFRSLVPESYRIIHNSDIVPHLPLCDGISGASCKDDVEKPFHQPQEIWYNSRNTTMIDQQYKSCDENNGEDPYCSNSLSNAEFLLNVGTDRGFDMHLYYYNHNLDEYGNKGCPGDALPTTTSIPTTSTNSSATVLMPFFTLQLLYLFL